MNLCLLGLTFLRTTKKVLKAMPDKKKRPVDSLESRHVYSYRMNVCYGIKVIKGNLPK